jgi:hypothetical protein
VTVGDGTPVATGGGERHAHPSAQDVTERHHNDFGATWGENYVLFLSYAEEDSVVADPIAEWFGEQGIVVFNWRAPQFTGGRFDEQIEEAIAEADDFVALLSPSYLDSDYCQMEKDLALHREFDLRKHNRNRVFIHVLMVEETPHSRAGFLRRYAWTSLVGKSEIAPELTGLAGRLWPRYTGHGALSPRLELAEPDPTGWPTSSDPLASESADEPAASANTEPTAIFRNRDQELLDVRHGLRTPGSQCFWLVIAPPQLGKSWFINRVREEAGNDGWTTSLIDVRQRPIEDRANAAALLAQFFGIDPPDSPTPELLHSIAVQICGAGRPYLCLLDSAELLDQPTATALRSYLSAIFREIDRTGNSARLAFVVASRREDRWRGATESPRFSVLTLSEFTLSVVRQALIDVASTGVDPYTINIRELAEQTHALTEGLPALLVSCLRWIRHEQWLGLDRLATQAQFELLAEPYIRDSLFARDSLFSKSAQTTRKLLVTEPDEVSHALEQAYRTLAPYRFFTQSHVRYQLLHDQDFKAAVESLGWPLEDLWNAIGEAALLQRPLDELWHETHPAIRRLLYRHYFKSAASRTEAHKDALDFVKVWSEKQFGKEQVVGLVECLWHHAMALAQSTSEEFERLLTSGAAALSRDLKPSPLYTLTELRRYAAERITNDAELNFALSHVYGLGARLIEIIISPPEAPET